MDPKDIKVVRTINITPTWAAMCHVIELALVNGTHEGREIARQEMRRMARAADQWNASVKKGAK